jgi:hypothetical protein
MREELGRPLGLESMLRSWDGRRESASFPHVPNVPKSPRPQRSNIDKMSFFCHNNLTIWAHGPMETGANEPMQNTRHSPGYCSYRANVANSLEQIGQTTELAGDELAIVLDNYRTSRPCSITAFEIKVRRAITAIMPGFYS